LGRLRPDVILAVCVLVKVEELHLGDGIPAGKQIVLVVAVPGPEDFRVPLPIFGRPRFGNHLLPQRNVLLNITGMCVK
jgi:hypothetical protein